jgi:hypothetical protein
MKSIKPLLMTLVSLSLIACSAKIEPKSWSFDFTQDDSGFESVFADYHDDGHNFETFEMAYERVVISGTTNPGLRLQGHNRSDDLFMGIVKELSGLKASTTYTLTLSFTLYTEAEAGSIGIGGSPADSVYVKAGFTNVLPEVIEGQNGLWVLNIDKGQQSQGSAGIPVVGTMAKPEGSEAGFVSKGFEVTLTLKTDASGKLWLVIGSDSGYEGLTVYYLDDIAITATVK